MRVPELRVTWAEIVAVVMGESSTLEAPAACFDEGPLMLREAGGWRFLAVRVLRVRVHTGARDLLTVEVV